MPSCTALVTTLAVLFEFFVATASRSPEFGVPLPAIAGHPDFERVFRVHMNTFERMPILLPLLWLCALYFSDRVAALLGLV